MVVMAGASIPVGEADVIRSEKPRQLLNYGLL